MSDCLLTTLPVKVPGDLEKMGYLMLKSVPSDIYNQLSIHVKPTYGVPMILRWNKACYYGGGTATSPYSLSGNTQYYTLSWTPKSGYTIEEATAWVEKANIRSIEFIPNNRIKEESGFEWMINSDDANLEFLEIPNYNIIGGEIFKCRGSNLKCLRMAANNLQNYQVQELLDSCPNLIYVYLYNNKNSLGDTSEMLAATRVQNVIFPDNLKYIRTAPDKITYLSANCVECAIDSRTNGNIEDYIAKAIAAGRTEDSLSIRRDCDADKLSSSLKYRNNTLTDELGTAGITSQYFVFSWTVVSDEPVITLASAESQHSYDLTYINYRNPNKLGPEFGVTE